MSLNSSLQILRVDRLVSCDTSKSALKTERDFNMDAVITKNFKKLPKTEFWVKMIFLRMLGNDWIE